MNEGFRLLIRSPPRGQDFAREPDDVTGVEAELLGRNPFEVKNGVLDPGHDAGVEEVEVSRRKNIFPKFQFDTGASKIFRRFGLVRLFDLFSHDEAVVRIEIRTVLSGRFLLVHFTLFVRSKMLVDMTL